EAAQRVVVIAESANLYDESRVIETVAIGTILTVQEVRGPWMLVKARALGWVRGDQVAAIDKAVPLLAKTVRDRARDPVTRGRAATALGEIGKPATPAIPDLMWVRKEGHEVPGVQDAAARTLVKLVPPDLP